MNLEKDEAMRRLERRRAALQAKLSHGRISARVRKHTIEVELPQVEDAVRRVRQGTYGDCVTCGEPIAENRLEAIPEVPECKGCEHGRRRN